MKVLVNASGLVVGGGIQIGVSFIEEALKIPDVRLKFLVSSGIHESLPERLKSNADIVLFKASPAHPLHGRDSRKRIKAIEKDFNPDIVYSIGFPSYIRFKKPEIGRYTNPWEINPKPLPWYKYPKTSEKIKIWLGLWYRIFWARRADYIETQTEAAKLGISKRAFYPIGRIKVIPNSPNSIFIQAGRHLNEDHYRQKKNMIFSLGAPHRHKNFDFIPYVAAELQKLMPEPPVFILTIPFESPMWAKTQAISAELGVTEYVVNVGKLKLSECIEYYKEAKAVFLPTLLEIFSATYVEAMAMKVPIVTTDLDFARDNCGDAALFYKPESAKDAADKLYTLLTDEKIYVELVKKGLSKLASYPSIEGKYQLLFNWFREITNEHVTN